ncbi:MAG: hypothetical protein ABTD50_09225 [Polyangiaceae bacterium]|jgi:hypothetical protein
MKTSNRVAPLAIAFAFVTGCSQLLNLDQFSGAVLDQPDSNSYDAQSDVVTTPDVTVPDSSPTDAPPAEASDSAVQPESSLTDARAGEGAAPPDGAKADAGDGGASPVDADSGSEEGPGASDAAEGGDANEAGIDWCAANSTASTVICRDFDDGKSYAYDFTPNINLVASGTAPTLSNALSDSPPNSVLFILPILPACHSDGGGACSEQMQLNANVQPSVAHPLVQVAFAVDLINYDSNNVHDLSLVAITYNDGAYTVSWDLQGTGSVVLLTTTAPDGGVGSTVQDPTPLPALGEWVNVVLTLNIGEQTVALTLDGTPALNAPIAAPAISGNATVTVGVNRFVGPTTPLSMYLDNVLISTD